MSAICCFTFSPLTADYVHLHSRYLTGLTRATDMPSFPCSREAALQTSVASFEHELRPRYMTSKRNNAQNPRALPDTPHSKQRATVRVILFSFITLTAIRIYSATILRKINFERISLINGTNRESALALQMSYRPFVRPVSSTRYRLQHLYYYPKPQSLRLDHVPCSFHTIS